MTGGISGGVSFRYPAVFGCWKRKRVVLCEVANRRGFGWLLVVVLIPPCCSTTLSCCCSSERENSVSVTMRVPVRLVCSETILDDSDVVMGYREDEAGCCRSSCFVIVGMG